MTNQGDRKIWAFGEEAQAKIAEGLKKGAEVVASTLGVGASNVLIERKFQTPQVIDDGYTAINNLILEDELENLGVTSLVDAANKQSKHAGDGTSTAIVLTKAIYDAGRKLAPVPPMVPGKSPQEIKGAIMEARDFVLAELKRIAKPIKTKADIRAVAYAAYSDDIMADIVADLVEWAGENGQILVEDGWGRENEVERAEGMRFAAKLPHNLFSNTPEEGLDLENVPIIVTDFDFVNLNDLMALLSDLGKQGDQNIVVIANKFERMAIDQIIRGNLLNAQNRHPFRVWLVQTPSRTPSEYENLAIFLGARYFSKEKGESILEAKVEELGRASKFNISKNGDGLALGGAGKQSDINIRIADLRKKMDDMKVEMIKNRVSQEIASMASATGIIKVASPSDGETEHIRLKTKNAVKSAQAAISEGIVPGGGFALKKISDKLPADNILKEALRVPYEIIERNSGGKIGITGVFDAVKVIRTAVEQACSQAWLLINTSTAIAVRNPRDFGDAADKIYEAIIGQSKSVKKHYDEK